MTSPPPSPRSSLDVARLFPRFSESPRVGIIGAGMSGLACAHALAGAGWRAVVLDKGRREGGRVATRSAPDGEGRSGIDHGAQYFTARDERFRRRVEELRGEGLVAEWRGRFVELDAGEVTGKSGETERLVGVPGMDAVPLRMAVDLREAGGLLYPGWHAEDLERREGAWWVVGRRRREGGETEPAEAGPFDVVVAAMPPAQAVPFLEAGRSLDPAAAELAQVARGVEVEPCWAALLGYGGEEATGLPFDGAFVQSGPLSWIARNSSKPGRRGAETWVLHAGPEWSRQHLEDPAEEVLPRLLAAFAEATGRDLPEPASATAHRWRYARPEPLDEPFLFSEEAGLAACGDWCGGPRVEGAWLSGLALAERLVEWYGGDDG